MTTAPSARAAPTAAPALAWLAGRQLLPSRAGVLALAGATLVAALARGIGVPLKLVESAGSVAAAVALAACVADLALTARAWRRSPVTLSRRLPDALAIGVAQVLQLRLANTGPLAWQLAVFDHPGATVDIEGLPLALRLGAHQEAELAYRVVPRLRGQVHFARAQVRLRTRWGLFEVGLRLGQEDTLRVYPNFAAVARYAWLSSDQRLAEIGIKSFAQRGSGTDFKQLADYRPGSPLRHVDWRATLRHGRPIVREYQEERDQRVLFVLDCGRRMRADEGSQRSATGHFDDALNAMVLLAYVALHQGDEVGAVTFGTRPEDQRHFAPRKGNGALNALIGHFYDVQPQPVQPDFAAMAADVMRLQPRRALVVVLTNFRDEDAGELAPALRLLRRRHLVLVASLRERALREIASQPQDTTAQVVETAAAHLLAQSRADAFARLAGRDGLLVDVEPDGLAAALVNRYHAAKRAGLL